MEELKEAIVDLGNEIKKAEGVETLKPLLVRSKELLFDTNKWKGRDNFETGVWKGKIIEPIISLLKNPKAELRVAAAETIAEIILKTAKTHQFEVTSFAAGYVNFWLQPKEE